MKRILIPILIIMVLGSCWQRRNERTLEEMEARTEENRTLAKNHFDSLYQVKKKIVEGKTYLVATIGGLEWMVHNLDVKVFRNGDTIPVMKSDEEWYQASRDEKPAMCHYDFDPSFAEYCGELYNWYAVNDPRGLAPAGWRIPSDEDWIRLELAIGMEDSIKYYTDSRRFDDGHTLKSGAWEHIGKTIFPEYNYGFNALPCGSCDPRGEFEFFGEIAAFWCSEGYELESWYRQLDGRRHLPQIFRGQAFSANGLSVRCVRDPD